MLVTGTVRYRKIKKLGEGHDGLTQVWEAEDTLADRVIAVKEIACELFKEYGQTDFFNEAKAMSASQNRSNVVPIHFSCDCRPDRDVVGIGMPIYPAGSSQDRIKNDPLSLREVVRVGLGMLTGLDQIHLNGYLHFDLKPSNILFDDHDNPMVADFGQAGRLNATTVTAAFPALYAKGAPPESQVSRPVGSIESDVWGAGLTLFRAAVGEPDYLASRPPESELNTAIQKGSFPDLDTLPPHIPQQLRVVLRQALSVNRKERYSTATEMQSALAGVRVNLDWVVVTGADCSTTWAANRPGQSALIVTMTPEAGRWAVQQFTRTLAGETRAREKPTWGAGLTQKQAAQSLRRIFRDLE